MQSIKYYLDHLLYYQTPISIYSETGDLNNESQLSNRDVDDQIYSIFEETLKQSEVELDRATITRRIETAKCDATQDGFKTSQYIQNYGITDEKALIEIAKIAAAQSGAGISKHIQDYGITDKAALIEIAKIAAAQNGWVTSAYIQNYGFTNEKALIEIAKIAVAGSSVGTSGYIQNYGITDEKALIEIAKIAAARDGVGTSEFIHNYGISDEKALVDIAKIAAAEYGPGASRHIQNYGIKDKEALIEIAKIAAAHRGAGTSKYIQNYGIKDKKALIEIAKIAAAQFGEGTSLFIQNYEINDEKALIEIAKIAAEQSGEGTSVYIQNYGIKDEKALIEIARIAAAQHGAGTSENIQNYRITDESALIEIARTAAAQSGGGISQYIQKYRITKEDALIEIAKVAAAQDGAGTSTYIKNYGVQDKNALIEIAKIAASQHCAGISLFIQNYGITDEKALIEIAKIAAAQSDWGISHYIQRYEITDEKELIEIAKIAAAHNGRGTSLHIQNYGIKEKNALIEIAKIAAAQNGEGISELIQNYRIADEKALIEIAKIAAAQSGWRTSQYIQHYGIKDGEALIEIAKIAAAQNGMGTSTFIKNYGIKDEKALIEIAKIAAAQDGAGTSQYINKYEIADENAMVEIAKIAAARDGVGTTEHINKYGIKDEKALIEIAKIAAAQDAEGTTQYIKKYRITKENALIEIAKIAAAQDGWRTSIYIQNYGIKDEKALIEIAKIAAAQCGWGTSLYIQNYGIKDEKALIEIAKIAAAQDGWGISYYIQNYGIKDEKGLVEIGMQALYSILEKSEEDNLAKRLNDYVNAWKDSPLPKGYCAVASFLIENPEINSEEQKTQAIALLTEDLQDLFPKQSKEVAHLFEHVLNTATLRWCFALRSFLLDNASEDHVKMLLDTGLLMEIGCYRDPKMRFTLLKLVGQLLKSERAKAEFNAKLKIMNKESKKYLKGIPSLYYALLREQEIDANALEDAIAYLQQRFYYSDLAKQRKLIDALQIVVDDTYLTPVQKTGLLECIFPKLPSQQKKGQLLESYKQAQALIGLAGFSHLKSFRDNPCKPSQLLENEFKAVVPFGSIPDFADRFDSEVSSSRSPTAVLTYAGVLSKLSIREKNSVLSAYGNFINWVLNKTYFSNRYDLEKQGTHLMAVFKNRQELLEEWKKGSEMPFKELMGEQQKNKELKYSFSEVLRQKIFTDRHLDANDYPLLAAFLKDASSKIEESHSEVEKLLIELASVTINEETEEKAEQKIKETSSLIDQLLEKNKSQQKCFPDQFINDLEDMKKQSKSLLARSSYKGLVAVDTDNPIDMLLSGTDVSGSCQRVDGSPNLNKCLVAYLLDGKNRMIAIKNEDGKIIARSILRVMLSKITQEPVLLLERVYQGGANEALKDGVIAFARKRAQELNLPLVSKEIKGNGYFDSAIFSLGSCAPYEYVDSADGVQQNGVFTISFQDLHLL